MKVEKIRVSIGSASVLGLGSIFKFKEPPTTCYLMTYKEGHCTANCGFCPQARSSSSSDEMLSRVTWPVFSFKEYLTKLKYLKPSKQFKRICIQTLNYTENFIDLMEIITQIKTSVKIPISVAIPPMSIDELHQLKEAGVQRVGIALDGTTPEIFSKIKGDGVGGPYNWEEHFQQLLQALKIFSEGYVSTHIIVGLGEREKDVISLIEELNNMKILISLFAFTPIKGTRFADLTQPPLLKFRKLQLGRHLIVNKGKNQSDFTFNNIGDIVRVNINKKELADIIYDSDAFLTSGCPGCNRPYYTSKPSGPIYNYPRKLTERESEETYNLLNNFVN